MIKASSIEELVRLHAKAQAKIDKMIENEQELPEVIFDQFRHYRVASSDGKKFYHVQLGVNAEQHGNTEPTFEFWVACTCYGSLHKEVCYHSALALTEHLKEVERREQAKQATASNIHEGDNAPYLQQGSNKKPKKIGGVTI